MFEQDRLLVRLQQKVVSSRDVAACFLSGSYGRRQADSYSDIDMVLIFRSEDAKAAAWQKRRSFAQEISPYVPVKSFDADHVRPFFHIALYSTGTKIDFRYESKESLTPNPWDRDLRILIDENGFLEAYQTQSAQISRPALPITAEQLLKIDQRFWVMFWDVFRQVLRGEFDKPYPIYLQLLHYTLPPLIEQLPTGTPVRHQLLIANFSQQLDITRSHLSQLMSAYVDARNKIVQDQHLDIEFDQKFETAVQQLVKRHT